MSINLISNLAAPFLIISNDNEIESTANAPKTQKFKKFLD